jgi:hypothetical protein
MTIQGFATLKSLVAQTMLTAGSIRLAVPMVTALLLPVITGTNALMTQDACKEFANYVIP